MAWVETTRRGRFRGRYKDGRRTTKSVPGSFATKREALKAARDEEAKIRAGTWLDPSGGRTTFSDYFENVWLPSQTKELSSIVAYESAYRRHFKPEFGHMRLVEIMPTHVQAWVARLQKRGYAPATVRKLLTSLQVSAYYLTCRSAYDLTCRSRRGDHGTGSPVAVRSKRSLSR